MSGRLGADAYQSADKHALQLAGALGIIYTLAELWKAGPKTDRMFE